MLTTMSSTPVLNPDVTKQRTSLNRSGFFGKVILQISQKFSKENEKKNASTISQDQSIESVSQNQESGRGFMASDLRKVTCCERALDRCCGKSIIHIGDSELPQTCQNQFGTAIGQEQTSQQDKIDNESKTETMADTSDVIALEYVHIELNNTTKDESNDSTKASMCQCKNRQLSTTKDVNMNEPEGCEHCKKPSRFQVTAVQQTIEEQTTSQETCFSAAKSILKMYDPFKIEDSFLSPKKRIFFNECVEVMLFDSEEEDMFKAYDKLKIDNTTYIGNYSDDPTITIKAGRRSNLSRRSKLVPFYLRVM